jgi:multiple sugar transport system permease protein
VVSHAVLLGGAAIMLMPFVWMFFTAIKAPSEIFEASIWPWPRTWYGFAHFQEVLKSAPMGLFMWNGLVVCTGILIVQVLKSQLACAYNKQPHGLCMLKILKEWYTQSI